MFKAFIFDLDGTLADTIPDLTDAVNFTLEKFGYPDRTREEIVSFIGNGQRMLVKRSLPENARDDSIVDECEKIYTKRYTQNLVVKTELYPNVMKTLELLRSHGARLGVVSNKSHEHVTAMINALFGEDFFDVIVGAGPFPRKPEPDSALFAAKKIGISPSDIAFVGDSDVDIKTAKNAGMFALGVSWGYRSREVLEAVGADAVIDDARSLSDYV